MMRQLCTSSAFNNAKIEAAGGERAVLALARANIYNLLASAYAEVPSARMACALADGTLLRAFRYAGLHFIEPELEALVLGRDIDDVLQEIEVEYTRLFVAPGPGYVPPYQSLHFGEDSKLGAPQSKDRGQLDKRQLWGDSAVAAQRMYAEAGLSVTGDLRDAPDHIGLELQFMHHLCSREAEALSSGDKIVAEESVRMQMAFLDALLLPWIDKFCQTVSKATLHPLYRALANLTSAFVVSDAEELRMLLNMSKNVVVPVEGTGGGKCLV